MILLLRLLIFLALLALALAWHQRNAAMISIDYFTGVLSLPLSVAMFLALAVGLLCGLAAAATGLLPMWWRNRRLQRQVETQRNRLAEQQPPPR